MTIDTATIARLLTALEDETYPCPCWDDDTGKHCTGRVTYEWEDEDEKYSWPVFSGCEKHCERMNEDADLTVAESVMAMSRERHRLRQIAGLA